MTNLSRREKERLAREEEIISVAETVFIDNGYEKASMEKIASKAGFTRRTVYQYFLNKEDLYYAVVLRGFRKLYEYFMGATGNCLTGFDKLYQAGLAYYRFFRDHPGTFHLMNYIGFVKREDSQQPKYRAFMEFNEKMFREFGVIIENGIKDGSIRSNLDPAKGAYALAFITTGFINEISMAGRSFAVSHDMDLEEFVDYSYSILMDSLRAQ